VASAVEALVRTFEKIYAERAIGFTVSVPGTIRFQGERQDFEEMVGNLVDNACKWARHAVAISIASEPWRNLFGAPFLSRHHRRRWARTCRRAAPGRAVARQAPR
jgi:hypothetical protein